MKKIRLKPYVYKVKGAKNYAFYDLLNEKLYQVSPEGELETFKKQLLESGLAVETSGIVSRYFFNEAYSYTKHLHLRQLQLRINSECGGECVDCGNLCSCFKGGANSLSPNFEKVFAQFTNFIIDNVDNLTFFYTQKFNSCWGNTAAIDVDGAIKPCLWSDEILGNIFADNIKNMIAAGAFNKYWEMPVFKIETCGQCEYRNGCRDCRVLAKWKAGSYSVKNPACSYNPETGEWE